MIINFSELYGAEVVAQQRRYEEISQGFAQTFGDTKGVEFYSAPGRTEVGGNHTDHNHGQVLAASVNLDIVGLARPIEGDKVILKSAEYPEQDEVELSDISLQEKELGKSVALIKGICARCRELGYQVGGFEAYTKTRVLKGSGLSSSAAFEVLIVTIISHLFNEDKIDSVTAAKIAQYAENVYFGKPSGLLDQMASSVGGFTAMDLADTDKPIIEKIEFDINKSGHALCVVDTGGNHADLTDEYAAVPKEMGRVAAYFGKKYLREVNEADFYSKLRELRREAGDRAVLRAMHFFDDNRAAAEEAEALRSGNFELFKKMISASGRSSLAHLQNVFASSAPYEQGLTLALALSEKILGDKGAYRVHGGGFAGTIQAFVPLDMLEEYRGKMEAVFGEGTCYVLSIRPVGGVKVKV